MGARKMRQLAVPMDQGLSWLQAMRGIDLTWQKGFVLNGLNTFETDEIADFLGLGSHVVCV